MNTATRSTGRTLGVAVRAMLAFTVLCGIVYTVAVTGVGQLVARWQANGSVVTDSDGDVVGSALLGQGFVDADGNPLPQYFQSRPSAEGWTGTNSYGSNYGPESSDLIDATAALKAQIAELDGVAEDEVPADAVTASGSGLDPDISPEYAAIQVERVAAARGLSVEEVSDLVAAHTQGRVLGYLGEPTVNVLELNLALDETEG